MLELAPKDLELVRQILTRHLAGRAIRAFGSRVTNRAKPFSDLDLAIMGDEPIPAQTLAELALDFEESDLSFRVDILQWTEAPDSLRQVIMHTSLPVIES